MADTKISWRQGMKVKIGLGITAVAVLLTVLVTAVSTHGWLWSVDEFRYKRMINSLPTPVGFVFDTNRLYSSPDYPRAERRYDVNGEHHDVVAFFTAVLPKAGWKLLNEQTDVADSKPTSQMITSWLVFDGPEDRCLEIAVRSDTKWSEERSDAKVLVELDLLAKRSSWHLASRIDRCKDYESVPSNP